MTNTANRQIHVFIGAHYNTLLSDDLRLNKEPHQSLHNIDVKSPIQQRKILYETLVYCPRVEIYTNSPYVIGYLSLAIKAYQVAESLGYYPDSLKKLVPEDASIHPDSIKFFEVTEDGDVTQLPTFNGLPSDDNLLNNALSNLNNLFDQMLELEEQHHGERA